MNHLPCKSVWRDFGAVWRITTATENNIERQTKTLVASGIRCQYSQGAVTTIDQSTGAPVVHSAHKLFCAADADITEGDRIVITRRDGTKLSLRVGEGFVYDHHKEFRVEREDTI